jgi:hypothetical protein
VGNLVSKLAIFEHFLCGHPGGAAADSSAFLNHSGLLSPDRRMASSICRVSSSLNRAAMTIPLAFFMPILGLPILFFTLAIYKTLT